MDVKPSKLTADPASSGAVSHELVGPSTERYAIRFFPPAAGTLAVNNRPLNSATDGAVVSSTTGELRFCVDDDGDVVQQEWHAMGSAAGALGAFLEVFY